MSDRTVSMVLMGLLLCFGGRNLMAQTYDPESRSYNYEGSQAPKFFVVDRFFREISDAYAAGQKEFYSDVLAPLGIEPNTAVAQSLVLAAKEAKDVAGPPVDLRPLVNDPVLFEKVQVDRMRKWVLGLRKLYQELLATLETNGVPPSKVENYLDEKIRPHVSVSVRPLGGSIIEVVKEFDLPPESAKPGK